MSKAKIGDKFPDVCCNGYDWEVITIIDDNCYGGCSNPHCPQGDGPYQGSSSFLMNELEYRTKKKICPECEELAILEMCSYEGQELCPSCRIV